MLFRCFFFILFSFSLKAQELIPEPSTANDVMAFRITNSAYDGYNQDFVAIDGHLIAAIYPCTQDSSQLCYTNRMLKDGTRSFGPISNVRANNYPPTDSTYYEQILYFDWAFTNDYDNKAGTAELAIILVHQPYMIKATIYGFWGEGEFKFEGYALDTKEGLQYYLDTPNFNEESEKSWKRSR